MATWIEARDKALVLGAGVQWVINWCWATHFRSPEDGQAFVKWCDENGVENRGYRPADPEATNPNLRTDGVRFR